MTPPAVATAFKPGTRAPAPPADRATGDLPWWAKAKPGGMTAAANEQADRMNGSKEAKKLQVRFND